MSPHPHAPMSETSTCQTTYGRRARRTMTSLLLVAGMTLGATGCAHASKSDSEPASTSDGAASGTSGQGKQTRFTVPDAAKAHTHAGAIAFVKFYWAMTEQLDAHPEAGVIPQFSLPSCTSCAAQEQTVKALASSGAHVKTVGTQLTNFTVRSEPVGDSVTVIFNHTNASQTRVDRNGSQHAMPRIDSRVGARLDWVSGGWTLSLFGADDQ